MADKFGNCERCDFLDHPGEKCKPWAVERVLVSSMINKFYAEMSDDIQIVLGVAGGIPIPEWGRLIAILAVNPDAARQMADRIRELRKAD